MTDTENDVPVALEDDALRSVSAGFGVSGGQAGAAIGGAVGGQLTKNPDATVIGDQVDSKSCRKAT